MEKRWEYAALLPDGRLFVEHSKADAQWTVALAPGRKLVRRRIAIGNWGEV